ncbi:MAG: hypothetical protein N3H30_00270 [Candidatus Micrarchaeota archaeon]|nr:hypothetical protein [Candidatus Micrarchaeota archaeon]
MATPRELMKRARKVLGPVAETIGTELTIQGLDDEEFEREYIERLAKITGNKKLVENILK